MHVPSWCLWLNKVTRCRTWITVTAAAQKSCKTADTSAQTVKFVSSGKSDKYYWDRYQIEDTWIVRVHSDICLTTQLLQALKATLKQQTPSLDLNTELYHTVSYCRVFLLLCLPLVNIFRVSYATAFYNTHRAAVHCQGDCAVIFS